MTSENGSLLFILIFLNENVLLLFDSIQEPSEGTVGFDFLLTWGHGMKSFADLDF